MKQQLSTRYGILVDGSWSDQFIVLEVNGDLGVNFHHNEDRLKFIALLKGETNHIRTGEYPHITYIKRVPHDDGIDLVFAYSGKSLPVGVKSESVEWLLNRFQSASLPERKEYEQEVRDQDEKWRRRVHPTWRERISDALK